jgi:dissimilatory sulfite reductase (desulfoviridin) alpha/beta subunit
MRTDGTGKPKSVAECPHDGVVWRGRNYRCRECGTLCDMCKQDRADERNKTMIDELA